MNIPELSRGFRTENPCSAGKLLLTTENRTSVDGEPYTIGHIDVRFTEPTEKTVGVGLIPSFETVEAGIIADDLGAKGYIGFGLHLLLDGPI